MRVLPFALLGLVLLACADNWAADLGTSSAKLCVPNQTLQCQCGIDRGTQLCKADQTLSACKCPQKTDPNAVAPPGETDDGNVDDTTAPRCGDGTIDPGEACDDGNTRDSDGCSSSCRPDGSPASGETCPGQPVVLWRGTPLAFGGTTAGYKHDHAAMCDEWAMGPDRVYGIVPKSDGVLTIDATLADGFDAVISIRQKECTNSNQEPFCKVTKGAPFKGVISVKKDEPVFILIDTDSSHGQESGVFSLELELQ